MIDHQMKNTAYIPLLLFLFCCTHKDSSDQIVQRVVADFEQTFRKDSVEVFDLEIESKGDFFFITIFEGGPFFSGATDRIPYSLYTGKMASYCVIDFVRKPDQNLQDQLRRRGLLIDRDDKNPLDSTQMRWLQEDLDLYYYVVCKTDYSFERIESQQLIQKENLPKPVCQ